MTRNTRRPHRAGEAGFTLVEMIIVVALIGLLALWGVPSFLATLQRSRLVGAAKEVAVLMQVARLDAIKRAGVNGDPNNWVAAVQYQPASGGVPASFRILVDETAEDPPVWNPVTRAGGVYYLPNGVTLRAPSQVVDGTASIFGWDDVAGATDQFPGPIFRSDGSVTRAGAYRLANNDNQYLEVQIEFPATGKLSIQKWFDAGPAGWFENHEAGRTWQW
jgi:prepilin-type N-terminal cleavage/methylation domain-containing protein